VMHQGASLCDGVVKQRHRAGRPSSSQALRSPGLTPNLVPFGTVSDLRKESVTMIGRKVAITWLACILLLSGGLGSTCTLLLGQDSDRDLIGEVKRNKGTYTYNLNKKGVKELKISFVSVDMSRFDFRVFEAANIPLNIDMNGCNIIKSDLSAMAKSRFVESVRIANSPVADSTISILSRSRHLKNLDLEGTSITDDWASNLAALDGLQSLGLANTNISDLGLENIGNLKLLTYLDLSTTKITNKCANSILKLKNLEYLSISCTKITDLGLKTILEMQALRNLDLSLTPMTGRGFAGLGKPHSLEYLNISHSKVDIKYLNYLNNLKILYAQDIKINEESTAALSNFPLIEELFLEHSSITDKSFLYLKKCELLRILSVDATRITGRGLTVLSELKSLRRVSAIDTKVTLEDAVALEKRIPGLVVIYGPLQRPPAPAGSP